MKCQTFLTFLAKENFLSPLALVWVKAHFPLESPFIDLIQIIRIVILQPWALFGFRFCIIFSVSLLKYLIAFKLCNEGWKVVHYYYQEVQLVSCHLLHNHFRGKDSLLWKRGGLRGIFWLFKKLFNNNQ